MVIVFFWSERLVDVQARHSTIAVGHCIRLMQNKSVSLKHFNHVIMCLTIRFLIVVVPSSLIDKVSMTTKVIPKCELGFDRYDLQFGRLYTILVNAAKILLDIVL